MPDDDKQHQNQNLFGERASSARPTKAWRPSNCLLRLHLPQVERRVRRPIPSHASTSFLHLRLPVREPRAVAHRVLASTNEPLKTSALVLLQREAWRFLRYHLPFPESACLSLHALQLSGCWHFDQ